MVIPVLLLGLYVLLWYYHLVSMITYTWYHLVRNTYVLCLPDCEKMKRTTIDWQALMLYSYSCEYLFFVLGQSVQKKVSSGYLFRFRSQRPEFFIFSFFLLTYIVQTSVGKPRSVSLRCAMGMTKNLVIPIGGCGVPATQRKKPQREAKREGKGQREASLLRRLQRQTAASRCVPWQSRWRQRTMFGDALRESRRRVSCPSPEKQGITGNRFPLFSGGDDSMYGVGCVTTFHSSVSLTLCAATNSRLCLGLWCRVMVLWPLRGLLLLGMRPQGHRIISAACSVWWPSYSKLQSRF